MDLLKLQNQLKKDPLSYKSECLLHYHHFQSQLHIFQLQPEHHNKPFEEQIKFFSHVTPLYKEDLKGFPQELYDLLDQKFTVLHPEVRRTSVKALILLRNRNIFSPLSVLPLFFKLFACKDKELRKLVYSHIVSDIRKVNKKSKNNHVNTSLQNYLFTALQDQSHSATRKTVQVLIDLYRKNVWDDEKTVNIIATACFYKDTKTMTTACQFFLAPVKDKEDEPDSEEERKAKAKQMFLKFKNSHSKKTKKKNKLLEKALNNMQKTKEKKPVGANFAAIAHLNNPQGFAEKMFTRLKSSVEKFDTKLLMMNLISRVVGYHKLILLTFYSFLQKYVKPHQVNITYLLAVIAQSCHDLVPEDIVAPLVKTLANHFVNDRTSPQVMTIGLNTIREICSRCPLAMDSTLLRDLSQYKSHRDKGVAMASKSLITLFRNVNPMLLYKKDRGKFAKAVEPLRYGETRVAEMVPAVQLLLEDELERLQNPDEDNENWQDELKELQNENEGSESEWVNVNHSDGEVEEEEEEEGEEEDGDDEKDELDELLGDGDLDELLKHAEVIEEGEGEENEDEDNEEEEEVISLSKGKKRKRAEEEEQEEEDAKKEETVRADALRILGPEDYARIEYLKLKKAMEGPSKRRKTQDKDEKKKSTNRPPTNPSYGGYLLPDFIEPSDLLVGVKNKPNAQDRREANLLKAQETKDKYVSFHKREDKATTNYEKRKKLPYPMVKNSRAHRLKSSVSEKVKARRIKKKQYGVKRR